MVAIYNGILCADSNSGHGFPMKYYMPDPIKTWISNGILRASFKPGHVFQLTYNVPVLSQDMDFQ